MTIITVNAPQNGKGKSKLDDGLIKRIKNLEGVEAVTAKLNLEAENITIQAGNSKRFLSDWASIVGIDTGEMERLGIERLQDIIGGAWK